MFLPVNFIPAGFSSFECFLRRILLLLEFTFDVADIDQAFYDYNTIDLELF